jgi:hypothetical protein
MSDSEQKPKEVPPRAPTVTELLRRIFSRLGTGNVIAIAALAVSLMAFWIQAGDSSSSDIDRAEDKVASSESAKRQDDLLKSSRAIAEGVEKPNVPSLDGQIIGDASDKRILDFLDKHQDKVVRLKLWMDSDRYQNPGKWEDLTEEQKRYIPEEGYDMEEVPVGCLTTSDECQAGAIVFFEKCPGLGKCVGWYSGFWKIDGYFTVIAEQAQMGEMRFTLRPVAPEMVRLR